MAYKFDYSFVIGINVWLEQRSTRIFVGKLEQKDSVYIFSYNEKYLYYKKAIPLGQEFPLTKQHFESKQIFPTFQERIPLEANPAYPDYCNIFGISPTEDNIFVLLATIGRRGPSWFIFEPIWGDRFTGEDLKKFRKELGISTRNFGLCFGISQATIVRIENEQASGAEVLRFLEIFYHFPEAAAYYVEKYGGALHSTKREKLISQLLLNKRG
jgi:HipA-like protein